jgi:acyl-CoA synthetase (AMP-forming)/AMP-acid ligase II
MMASSRSWSWREWSRAGWSRHLPEIPDHEAFVAGLGEGTIHGLAHGVATAGPERPAINIDGATLTHGALDETASRAAGWLAARVAPGDRVLIAGPASPEWVAFYLGTLRAGGVAVPANPAYTSAELDELIGASGARLAVAWGDVAGRLAGVASRHHMDLVTDMGVSITHRADTVMDRVGPDATAVLAFTSGTTGHPKGVPLTHRNLLTSIRTAMSAWRWSRDDVLVHALPLFHQHGLGGLHATLVAGSSLHLLNHFAPPDLGRTVTSSRATVMFGVPTMYQRLAAAEEPLPAAGNRLRLAVSGSAPLSEEVAAGAVRTLGKIPLVRYGTTESGLDVSHVYGDPRELSLSGTIGVPLPGLEVRLAGEDGAEVPENAEGEIQLRGPQVFAGYWGDRVATASAVTADGWFRTGDIARLDPASDHLVIQGRSKEMIITGGLKVFPREVEIALEKHPSIEEAAVAGIPDEKWGEQVTAWVVLAPGHALDADALVAHTRSLLAAYKCPKQVFSLQALPRNQVGKVDRRKLHASSASPEAK